MKNLAQISIYQDIDVSRPTSFETQLAKTLPPKKYHPMFFELNLDSEEEGISCFEKFNLLQLCCDVIFAFQ